MQNHLRTFMLLAAGSAEPAPRIFAGGALILAAAPGWRPGPLVSRLAKGKPVSSRPIAVTVIPGKLTDEQLQEIGGMPG